MSASVELNKQIEIPAWINENYFRAVLAQSNERIAKIQHFYAEPVERNEENACSILLRIKLKCQLKSGQVKQYAFILKTMLETDNVVKFIKFLGQFPKEKYCYDELLPKFEQIYENRSGKCIQFSPRCVLSEETPQRITLVLDDLKARGFVNENHYIGMDFKHMCAALEKLAEFHAATAVKREVYGSYDAQFQVGLVSENSRHFFEERSADMLRDFTTAMQQIGVAQEYIDKLPSPQKFVDELLSLGKISEDGFNVLNHGDFWCNNLMFKYADNGDIAETLFVDFQLCKYGPPSYDLYVLIFTSALKQDKMQYFHKFIGTYHEHLKKHLRLLKYEREIPDSAAMYNIIEQDRFYAFFVIISYLPAVLMPPDNESNWQNRLKGGETAQRARLKSMLYPSYAQQMRELLPWLCTDSFDFLLQFKT